MLVTVTSLALERRPLFTNRQQEDRQIEIYVFIITTEEMNSDPSGIPEDVRSTLESVVNMLPQKSYRKIYKVVFEPRFGLNETEFDSENRRFKLSLEAGREDKNLQYEKLTLLWRRENDWEELWQVRPELKDDQPFIVGTSDAGGGEEALLIILTLRVPN